ncbi:DivIVA domain-containing protein [Micromonospora sp. DT44]|uniref:DivIVA domain-containing protein n=1 Tax=Micromonospora sp. DT44 TaxID=3393439 RepID=UPI003CF21A04
MTLPFELALRGYDMRQVESLFAKVDEALTADSALARAAARDALRAASFRRRLRGYDMWQVDAAIDQRLAALALPDTHDGPASPTGIPPVL